MGNWGEEEGWFAFDCGSAGCSRSVAAIDDTRDLSFEGS